VIFMWLQPPPPVADWWVLHIAATPHEVDDVLADLCIHKRARAFGDPGCPAFLLGQDTPSEPPAWMSVADGELRRRGYRTLWCDPGCPHHRSPRDPAGPAARADQSSTKSGGS
jgi:hypothetical protein